MTTEVNVTYTPSEYYSWENADLEWESKRADKPWDSFGQKGILDIVVDENIQINSGFFMTIQMSFFEKLFINDFNFSSSNLVMNDINFTEEFISSEDFANLKNNVSPLGYEATRPLISGEYTYKDAIVGIQMKSNLSKARLGVYGAKLNVDVEDVVERGRTDVTTLDINTPTKIEFKKKFYLPPEEVMFNVIAATEPAWVEIISKTDKYMEIVLKSVATPSNLVTGTVTWVATGY